MVSSSTVERGYIYQPNTIKGNKPINIGHYYSILSILPEKESGSTTPWSIPISGERVCLDKSGVEVGSKQISEVNGTKISHKSCCTSFPASGLGTHSERLCLSSSFWSFRLPAWVPSPEAGNQSGQGRHLNLVPFNFETL
jgi:hypothetical protein